MRRFLGAPVTSWANFVSPLRARSCAWLSIPLSPSCEDYTLTGRKVSHKVWPSNHPSEPAAAGRSLGPR